MHTEHMARALVKQPLVTTLYEPPQNNSGATFRNVCMVEEDADLIASSMPVPFLSIQERVKQRVTCERERERYEFPVKVRIK